MDDKYAIFQFAKSLFIWSEFLEHFCAELERASATDPYLEGDIYGAGANSAMGFAGECWREGWHENYLLACIQKGIRKDADKINSLINEAAIVNSRSIPQLIIQAEADIKHIKAAIHKYDHLKKVADTIANELDLIISELRIKAGISNSIVTDSIKPLRWNAGVATLTTLFNELNRSFKTSSGDVYLVSGTKELADFICKSFVDEAGNPFEQKSVERYLSSDKQAKRNKVDLNTLFTAKDK